MAAYGVRDCLRENRRLMANGGNCGGLGGVIDQRERSFTRWL